MKVSELMTKDPHVVSPDARLADALERMARRSLRHLPVVERGRLVGVISDRDLLEATGWSREHRVEADGPPKVVRDYMTAAVETVAGDDELLTAVSLLLDRRLGCLPVVDGAGRLEGILTVADLVAELVRSSAASERIGELDAPVAECMSTAPITVDARATVADALGVCRAHSVRHLPVLSDGWFVGLVSDRDLRPGAGRGERQRRVEEVMSTDLATIGPECLVSDAAELMRRRRVDSIPVTREGRLLGMLTTTDVLRLLRGKLAPA